jgi:enhancer of polycomb-like protein
MPQFPALEHLFSSPVPASFYPAYEVPKGLPDSKSLTRMARNIYHHWRQRREIRKGKSIFPSLNYDEANDGDPYVCFRRRDIRATRKTRRTDNYSVEKFQKLQYELQAAHYIVSMVQKREQYKRTAFTADKELWEAKWKFYETKRKWPSLGVSREEEEFITGRSHQQQQARAAENAASMNGAHAIQMQSANTPVVRKKQPDREKEERDRRERMVEMARAAEKGVAGTGRSMAPEHYKERLQALRQKLEDAIARRAAANADWDDLTDVSVIRWIIWVFH